MIIDVRKLKAQKQYSGTLEFSEKGKAEWIDIPFVAFASEISVKADYELYEDDSLELKGKIRYLLKGQCSRCLGDATKAVEGEIDAYFQPTKDAEDYSYSGFTISLDQAIADAVMASMPRVLLCKEDCVGIQYEK